MHIAYFITSHGYGHGVRSSAIAKQFSPNVKITFRTALPEIFFHEELKRSFSVFPAKYDCGCLQTDGVTVDIKGTLDTYKSIALNNRKIINKEVQWCQENKIDLIVSDITPLAFEIANYCHIPSVAVSNFTWYDIYSEYISLNQDFKPYLDDILHQYSLADMLIALQPSLEMNYFRRITEVPICGRKGEKRKNEIYSKYKIRGDKKLGLIYTGDFGMDSASWQKLADFSEWEFLSLHPLPVMASNFHIIEKKDFPYQDLTASADCVLSKLGYGVISECMLNGIPLVYLPRNHFAEYPVLENAVKNWGMGYCLSEEEYYNLHWKDALDFVSKKSSLTPATADGTPIVARIIESMID